MDIKLRQVAIELYLLRVYLSETNPDLSQPETVAQLAQRVSQIEKTMDEAMSQIKPITRKKLEDAFCYVYGEDALVYSTNFIKLAKKLEL